MALFVIGVFSFASMIVGIGIGYLLGQYDRRWLRRKRLSNLPMAVALPGRVPPPLQPVIARLPLRAPAVEAEDGSESLRPRPRSYPSDGTPEHH